MRSRTILAASVLTVAALLAPGGSAAGMPPQLRAFAVIHGHNYHPPYHRASGVLRLNNMSGHAMKVSCTVTVTWSRPNGAIAKRHRTIDAPVAAHKIRRLHFHMRFKDPEHVYNNVPSNAVPHCRLA